MGALNRQTIKSISLSGGLFLAAVTLILFFCNWVLGLLHFSSEVSQLNAHPPYCEEVRQNIEFQYVFKTNSRGLRYHDLPTERDKNSHRVFVSGDSFTEGWGVDDGERFTDLLENQFHSPAARVMFINGGLSGTGPLEYGRLFLNVGLKYNPDALLICLFVNDIANTPEELAEDPFGTPTPRFWYGRIVHYLWPRVYILQRLFRWQREYHSNTKTSDFIWSISRTAKERNIPHPQIDRWKRSLPDELVKAVNENKFNGCILSYGLLYPEYWSDSIDILSDRAKKKWKNMTYILSEILARSKQREIEVAMVLIPSQFHYNPKSHRANNPWIVTGTEIRKEWLSEDTEIQRKMRLWARLEGVPFLDLTVAFRTAIHENANVDWELDDHWNRLGHQVAAKAIASWLNDQQVFSFMKSKRQTSQ